jgi:hypothetical protein
LLQALGNSLVAQNLAAIVDLGMLLGVPACLMIWPVPPRDQQQQLQQQPPPQQPQQYVMVISFCKPPGQGQGSP